MADKKLFELIEGTPTDTDKIAFGQEGDIYKNVSIAEFKTLMQDTTNTTYNTLTVEIGAWDMESTSYKPVIPIIPPVPPQIISFDSVLPEKIRGINVMIKNDTNSYFCDFLSVTDGTKITRPQIQYYFLTGFFPSTIIGLERLADSAFTIGNYTKIIDTDGSPYSRGWVTVIYID